MFDLPFDPEWCPRWLLPLYWIIWVLFKVIYSPIYFVVWLNRPWLHRKSRAKDYSRLPDLRR